MVRCTHCTRDNGRYIRDPRPYYTRHREELKAKRRKRYQDKGY